MPGTALGRSARGGDPPPPVARGPRLRDASQSAGAVRPCEPVAAPSAGSLRPDTPVPRADRRCSAGRGPRAAGRSRSSQWPQERLDRDGERELTRGPRPGGPAVSLWSATASSQRSCGRSRNSVIVDNPGHGRTCGPKDQRPWPSGPSVLGSWSSRRRSSKWPAGRAEELEAMLPPGMVLWRRVLVEG